MTGAQGPAVATAGIAGTAPQRAAPTSPGIEPRQRRAARIVGALYLLTMAAAVYVDVQIRGRLIVPDAARTAENIIAHEGLFRAGLLSDLLMYVGVVTLSVGLYVVLRPIGRNLALLALLLRVVESGAFIVATLVLAAPLILLGGAEYLGAFSPEQLEALSRTAVSMWAFGYRFGLILLGLGSAGFSYLWLRSRYIPRPIAGWGIFASLLLTIVSATIVVVPSVRSAAGMAHFLPIAIYEVGLGLWLVVRGIRTPGEARK